MLAIINYGMGNLRSVQKAFERINCLAVIISDPADLSRAGKIILPGVGHFAQGMKNLQATGFDTAIKEAVQGNGKPILGICLGMQLLCNHSEEGDVAGLGIVDADVKRFPNGNLKIPHMGWNSMVPVKESPLTVGIEPSDLFYFVHSYYVTCHHQDDRLFETQYGLSFDAAFQHGNITGFQFHPEKSHRVGLRLLENFVKG